MCDCEQRQGEADSVTSDKGEPLCSCATSEDARAIAAALCHVANALEKIAFVMADERGIYFGER